MTKPRFLQIHTLSPYTGVLLNRDDSGLAKRLPYGDALRTRVSSPVSQAALADCRGPPCAGGERWSGGSLSLTRVGDPEGHRPSAGALPGRGARHARTGDPDGGLRRQRH